MRVDREIDKTFLLARVSSSVVVHLFVFQCVKSTDCDSTQVLNRDGVYELLRATELLDHYHEEFRGQGQYRHKLHTFYMLISWNLIQRHYPGVSTCLGYYGISWMRVEKSMHIHSFLPEHRIEPSRKILSRPCCLHYSGRNSVPYIIFPCACARRKQPGLSVICCLLSVYLSVCCLSAQKSPDLKIQASLWTVSTIK